MFPFNTTVFTASDLTSYFRYEVYEQVDRTWGAEIDGKLTGMIGEVQREEADICTASTITAKRIKEIDHSRIYPSSPMTLVSLQPTLLPQHLALVRPFTGNIILAVTSIHLSRIMHLTTIHYSFTCMFLN